MASPPVRRPANRFAPVKKPKVQPAAIAAAPVPVVERPEPARRTIGKQVPGVAIDVTIDRLGARGDGVAETPGGLLFLPLTVPGDRVRAVPTARRGDGWAGTVAALLAPGPDRAEPPCPHFGVCGGCTAQHLGDPLYIAWKDALLLEPLRRAGLDLPPLLPWDRAPPGGRRRVTLSIEGQRVGFNERGSHDVVDLLTCAIATPAIVAVLPLLRGLVAQPADATVLDTGNGLDIAIVSRHPPSQGLRRRAARWTAEAGVQRLTWSIDHAPAEVLAMHAAPAVDFGGVMVEPAAGGFLQPTLAGERALRAFVTGALAGTRHAIELFAGSGTFTFALALAGTRVLAVEGDAGAIGALDAAARRNNLAGKILTEQRDLTRQPLGLDELARADAVLLDPPRSGAAEQVDVLAASTVGRVVYVSCSPATFARDARVLADAGFRITKLLPVDQFLWSPHVELAAVLER